MTSRRTLSIRLGQEGKEFTREARTAQDSVPGPDVDAHGGVEGDDGDAVSIGTPSSDDKEDACDDSKREKDKAESTQNHTTNAKGAKPTSGKQSEAKVQSKKALAGSLKLDHENRPVWVCHDGRIFLESFSAVYKAAYDFLIAIAEPVSRPESIHEYMLTQHSLYAAVSVGLETETILRVLGRLSKAELPQLLQTFVRESTQNYGKVKLVLHKNRFRVESASKGILTFLLKDETIRNALPAGHRPSNDGNGGKKGDEEDSLDVVSAPKEQAAQNLADEAAASVVENSSGDAIAGENRKAEEKHYSFAVEASKVEKVKQRCLPEGLNYPMLEEYDFRNDVHNADLAIELKPGTNVRPYQEKSLSKMFGNGRARSGIIVLPCGAGKTLTGVAAACRVRKSVLVLCTNAVSVDQWNEQFKLWSTIKAEQIKKFTAQAKQKFDCSAGVCLTTYNMIAFNGKRSKEASQVLDKISQMEWGLIIMDEVHVVPAAMFRKVIGITKAHCKLGLTATLVREDERVSDLNFLIGPKLYEANWLDLQKEGYIANVQCAEVWCQMAKEYMREYLKPQNAPKKSALCVLNPNKLMALHFLMNFHEQMRGDKVIIFSDNIFALKECAVRLRRPFIYGGTSHAERKLVLDKFKASADVQTILLSKVGDNSIDIPEANVIIQISSHGGSRRQEAQRLGRILRPKKESSISQPSGTEQQHNAFFYSLVSTDTMEMYYSTKRQQFLVDQGYAFKIIPALLRGQDTSQLVMSGREERMNLLAKVLSADEQEAGEEVIQAGEDDIGNAEARSMEKGEGKKRNKTTLQNITGGAGLAYYEYDAPSKSQKGDKGSKEPIRKQLERRFNKKQRGGR